MGIEKYKQNQKHFETQDMALSPGETRTRVARELMRVEKREFASEFSQL
jgi:hypothetical protein